MIQSIEKSPSLQGERENSSLFLLIKTIVVKDPLEKITRSPSLCISQLSSKSAIFPMGNSHEKSPWKSHHFAHGNP